MNLNAPAFMDNSVFYPWTIRIKATRQQNSSQSVFHIAHGGDTTNTIMGVTFPIIGE
jgi:hypothetical protein